jgi:predicted nucleic acid-binding protein
MVLVDTSVWIRALSYREPYARQVDLLLEAEAVVGHYFVYGELLIGDRGGRKKFLAAYEHIYQAPTIPHHEVVAFVRGRNLHGRGVGWIDVHLLASAAVSGSLLWTADPRFASVAQALGIAYNAATS